MSLTELFSTGISIELKLFQQKIILIPVFPENRYIIYFFEIDTKLDNIDKIMLVEIKIIGFSNQILSALNLIKNKHITGRIMDLAGKEIMEENLAKALGEFCLFACGKFARKD